MRSPRRLASRCSPGCRSSRRCAAARSRARSSPRGSHAARRCRGSRSWRRRSYERRLDGAHQRAEAPALPAPGAGMSELLLRAGEWTDVTPESAGWDYLYFGVRSGTFESDTGDGEIALVPLSGGCGVEADGTSYELGGRENVFAGMPWALYLPRDTPYRVEAEGEVAICGA